MLYKTIEGNSAYSISETGIVININTGRRLKLDLTKNGYHLVGLFTNGIRKRVYVHRLVALAFISNPKRNPYINHIDGNKTNNNASNLEWCTPQENSSHAVNLGVYKSGNYKKLHNSQLLYTPTASAETSLMF